MSVMFHVWNVVISLSMAEPKSTMRDSDWGNRGVGNQEWSGVEQNGAERSRIRIIRIKIKEKCNIIALPSCTCNNHSRVTAYKKEWPLADFGNQSTLYPPNFCIS